MDLKQKVLDAASEIADQVVGARRHIHQNPELSFEEKETSKYIQSFLKQQGIHFTSGWAGTGVVGIIRGENGNGKSIALRADIDALPITEENEVPYVSKNPGVMHACGHDVHTSSLLGVATVLNKLKSNWGGTVMLVFQPGEERMPGGASLMIGEGAFNETNPEVILGQHVHPPLEVGKVGFCPGMSMASADEIRIVVNGKGGHAAMPHNTIDPVMITVEILSSLQQVVSRKNNPIVPSVLSFGRVTSNGGTYNVIPDSVEVLGTFRTFNEEWRYEAHRLVNEISKSIAAAYGGSAEVDITVGYPSLVNDTEVTTRCMNWARELLGDDQVEEIPPRMTAEDFSYYSQRMPACFYRLGVKNPDWDSARHVHTPKFNIDERALLTGPALMSWLTIKELSR